MPNIFLFFAIPNRFIMVKHLQEESRHNYPKARKRNVNLASSIFVIAMGNVLARRKESQRIRFALRVINMNLKEKNKPEALNFGFSLTRLSTLEEEYQPYNKELECLS